MTNLRQTNDQQQEAQRFTADQAGREVAQLDVVSVWIAVQVKLSEGRIEDAKAIVKAYREGTK